MASVQDNIPSSDSGISGALQFCNIKSSELILELEQSEGLELYRVSDKNRNGS